jgi:hypothetical protein
MKANWGVDVQIDIFVILALALGEWSVSSSGSLIPGERAPGTLCVGGWVGRSVGLNDTEKRNFFTLKELELQPLGRPARSQSLYRIRYPGSLIKLARNKTQALEI